MTKTQPTSSFTIRCPSELMKGIDEQVEQTRQTSYIWSEDAKGRDDGVEKVKVKTIPFTTSSRL